MNANKLQNENLKVISIHRQILENATPICCDNCGKTIINFAKVTNEKDVFRIGLDCKKKLIDNKLISNLNEYEAKEYKRELNDVNKFLLQSSRENTVINIDYQNGFISVVDTEKINQFGMKGESIYFNNLNFLIKHGLKDYINTLIK